MTKETILNIQAESLSTYNKLIKQSSGSDSLTSSQLLNGSLSTMLLCEIWLKLDETLEETKEYTKYVKEQDEKKIKKDNK